MTEGTARPIPGPDDTADPLDLPVADAMQILRRRAEALAAERDFEAREELDPLLPEIARRTLHELRVHQIELETQNEELRRTQEQLENSRERYFDLYDLAPVGYLTLSEEGLILEANLTAARLLGLPRGALVKHHLSRFIFADDQEIYFLQRQKLFAGDVPLSWEMRLMKKDAAPLWVRVEAATAPGLDGALVWRAVVSDITVHKQADRAIKTINEELQSLTYSLTHDLREPLHTVVVFNQLLAGKLVGKLDGEADQYLSFSVEAALRMEALMNGLIEYWRLTEGLEDPASVVDCNESLSEAQKSLEVCIQKSNARITADLLPKVTGSRSMMTQLFQNLISNSIKYRSEEQPAIHISVARIPEGWLFSVNDNGLGIEPRYAERIFGMFNRLHGREVPGTGIGLALCKKVVERQGGRIWVESELGKGAMFKFTILSQVS